MRLKYYKLTLRQMSLKKPFVFFLIFAATIILFVSVFNINIKPKIKFLSISNAKSVALKCTNNAVINNIKNIKYSDLIAMQKDSNGKITALNANILEMNNLSNKVSLEALEKLEELKESKIKIPLMSLLGADTFGGYGPNIDINFVPTGDVNVEFNSTFETAGINQTKHRIYLKVTMEIKCIAPFYNDSQKYINEVLIAETIIVGDIPNTYYNINGIKDLTKKDTLDLVD